MRNRVIGERRKPFDCKFLTFHPLAKLVCVKLALRKCGAMGKMRYTSNPEVRFEQTCQTRGLRSSGREFDMLALELPQKAVCFEEESGGNTSQEKVAVRLLNRNASR